MKKITEETLISDVIKNHPGAAKVFKKYKVDCIGCSGAENDRIKHVATAHGKDLCQLLLDLNDAIY